MEVRFNVIYLQVFLGTIDSDCVQRGFQSGPACVALPSPLHLVTSNDNGVPQGEGIVCYSRVDDSNSIYLQGDLRRMWSEPFIMQQSSKQLEV